MSTLTEFSDIIHYRDAIAALQLIDRADSNKLATLSNQMTTLSFKSPYANAFNTAIFQRWAEVDIDDAIDYIILSIDGNHTYTHWPYDGLKTLASIEPEYLLGKLEHITDTDISCAIFQGASAKDPEKVARYALSIAKTGDDHSGEVGFLPVVIFEWADANPKAAYEWVQSEASDVLAQTDLSPLMWKWFEKDSDTAIVEIERLLNSSDTTNPSDLYRYSEMNANYLAQSDPAAAYRWVREQDDPHIQDNMLTMVLHMWSESNPESLKTFISQLDQEEQNILRGYL